MAKKSCKKGYYYCYASKKCKKIPMGYAVGMGGWLRKEKEEEKSSDETEGKKKNGNGNGANGNGNGNGGSNGGSNGGGVSEAWSAKYKKSIDCNNPKGFSQRAHCRGRKMNEEVIVEKRDGKSAKSKGYSLRDWFKGGGWVQAGGKYDGKPCAKQPGQKTKPFCRDADDRASMSKDERKRRFAKKNAEDPNPNRRGKAKVVTASYSNWRADLEQLDEFLAGKPNDGYIGHPNLDIKNPLAKKQKRAPVLPGSQGGGMVNRVGAQMGDRNMRLNRMLNQSHELKGEVVERYDEIRPYDRIKMGDGKLRTIKDIDAKLKDKKPVQKNSFEPQGDLVDEGKKDACYHKVKSRYSVWPSAYASGALVKCRKVGAKNWGNKTKKESYDLSNWRDDFQATEYETVDLIKADPIEVPPSRIDIIKEGAKKKGQVRVTNVGDTLKKSVDNQIMTDPELKLIKKQFPLDKAHFEPQGDIISEGGKKCWKGYKKKGTQKLFGKTYNRCVKAHFSDWRADIDLQEKKAKKDYDGDGKIESGKDEYMGSRDKAIKKAIAMKEDWQKSNRKDGVDGMSQKSVNAYKRENPGSKLQTAVTEKKPTGKRAKRRTSFCARSKGQKDMHNIDCTKTPDKKICKARKRWRC